LNDKEAGEINLPQFSEALNKAKKMVDNDNHSENKYNDYGIDSTCEGTYYYIFTFENKQHPKTYFIVTVDLNNEERIFYDEYQYNKKKRKKWYTIINIMKINIMTMVLIVHVRELITIFLLSKISNIPKHIIESLYIKKIVRES